MRRKSRRQLFSDIDEPLYSCGLLESGDDVVGVLGGDWRGSAEKLGEPPRFRAVAVSDTSSPHTMVVLPRQQSICDNQCYHARENQQCREGFSDL